jgi:hypothetical protein
MMARSLALVASALLFAACNNNASNVVLASLDRSEKISLLCADVEQLTGNLFDFRQVLPLALCENEIEFAEDVQAQFLGAVTQTEQGTVAVVNFTNGSILDTNRTVPGVTALLVGEQPTAVQISPVDSVYTYVSSFSPKSVQAVPTEAVVQGISSLPTEEVRFEAGPSDLALHEVATFETITEDGLVVGAETQVSYRFLYAAIPDLGQVAQIEVEIDQVTGVQTLGAVTELPLPTLGCDAVVPVPPPPSDETDYNRICPQDFQNRAGRFIKTVETTVPCEEGDAPGPAPVGLIVDPGRPDDLTDDVLLVADTNQPVIHRFALSETGATEMSPIFSLAPTTELDVTPYVPGTSDSNDRTATERYLYAIAAKDGSVLAIDYTEDSETFGAVLPVLAGVSPRATEENVESRNRVRSGFSNARAIEVLSPFYELEVDPQTGELQIPAGDPETDICDPDDDDAFALAQNPRNMRGVFLGVSLSSGQMFFLDIYDLNAPCRGGEGPTACTLAETGPDQFASIRRHRRRFGFTPTTFISIDGTPSLQFNEAPGVLDETTGAASASNGPGLEFIECPTSQFNVFGIPPTGSAADGLICASSQVWSSFTQRWDARWQGVIPDTEGGLGLFSDQSYEGEPGNWFLAGDVPFCRVGVLGRQSGTPGDTGFSIDLLPSYVGDRLVIVGELPPSTRDDEDCQREFEDLLDDVDQRQVWFPIVRAFDDQLEIGPSPNPDRYTLEETQRCFNQFTQYQIHTRDVYTVTGTSSGFINRVVPDENTGECIFDAERPVKPEDVDTFLTARAFPGTQFVNPLVSFEISDFDDSLTLTDSTVALLNFNILNQFGIEILDTGGSTRSLPASMLFSPENEQLFFVDFHAGVRRIVFNPLNIVQTFD